MLIPEVDTDSGQCGTFPGLVNQNNLSFPSVASFMCISKSSIGAAALWLRALDIPAYTNTTFVCVFFLPERERGENEP